ncbi:hypothetical protein EV715DRAFT_297805 [Schizophyllum commune]
MIISTFPGMVISTTPGAWSFAAISALLSGGHLCTTIRRRSSLTSYPADSHPSRISTAYLDLEFDRAPRPQSRTSTSIALPDLDRIARVPRPHSSQSILNSHRLYHPGSPLLPSGSTALPPGSTALPSGSTASTIRVHCSTIRVHCSASTSLHCSASTSLTFICRSPERVHPSKKSTHFASDRTIFPVRGRTVCSVRGRAVFLDRERAAFPDLDRAVPHDPGRVSYSVCGRAVFSDRGCAAFCDLEHAAFLKPGRAVFPDRGRAAFPDRGRAVFPTHGRAPFPDRAALYRLPQTWMHPIP